MALVKRKVRSPYAEKTISTRLTHGDDRELRSIAKSEETDDAKVARKLISEALFARRMKRDQKDATTTVIYEAQRKAMSDSLSLVTGELKEMRGELQTLTDTVVRARDEHTETLNYLRRAATRLVMDVVAFHLLMRNYVYTFLSIFISKAGVKKDASEVTAEYSAAYKKFMQEGRAAAERLGDGDVEILRQQGAQIIYKTDVSGGM
jgi:hypothetical protein